MRIIYLCLTLAGTLFLANTAAAHKGCSDLLLTGPADPNNQQRELALALELQKLKPAPAGVVVFANAKDELQVLSEANTNRVLSAALRNQRQVKSVKKAVRDRLAKLLDNLEFVAIRPLNKPWIDGLYDNLTENKHSHAFRLIPVPKSSPTGRIQHMMTSDVIRLKPSFAAQNGMVLPLFTTIYRLMRIFEVWNPDILEDVVRINRYNLPQDVRSHADLKAYLRPDIIDEVFPADALRNRLRPLREALHNFVFTVEDAETISVIVLRQYLLQSLKNNELTIGNLEKMWHTPGIVDRLFRQACAWIGFEGLSLRVPLSLTTDYYSIVHPNLREPPLLPKQSPPRPWEQPRIDHDSKPD